MKHMKKLAGLALAMVMLVALAVPAMAVTTFVKGDKVPDSSIITTYQIFKGDSADQGKSLANIQWGDNLTKPDDFIRALRDTGIEEFQKLVLAGEVAGQNEDGEDIIADASSSAQEVATAINAALPLGADMLTKIAEAAFKGVSGDGEALGTEVADGWYLIRNRDTKGDNDPSNDSNTLTLQQVTSASGAVTTINPKAEVPGLTKKIVKDENRVDETDAAFGETIKFELTANLPSNFSSDSVVSYTMVFHDQQEDGLTLNADSIQLTAKGTELVKGVDYTVEIPGADGHTFDVKLIAKGDNVSATVKNLGLSNGDSIVVSYTATLNENANTGTTGNKNTAKLTYTENNTPKDTPEDTVIVFTFNGIVNKVDPEGKPLTGAEFELVKVEDDGTTSEPITVTLNDEETSFTFAGLKAGKYILTETKAPEGYNKLEKPIYFVIEYGTTNDDVPVLNKLEAYQTDENWKKVESNATAEFVGNLNPDDANVSTNVVNGEGIVLPDTGGIGTTIFYIVGGVLVAAAAILLITKRRMNLNED
jgi:fimbrial isopeptide formation D2 family protein/LPXTG-motif cell wall-anchored protein